MAFASTVDGYAGLGNKKVAFGTFTNGSGDTGGDIDTGLSVCEFMNLQHKGTAVTTNAPVVNETYPVAGNAVTIVTDDNADGYWWAFGY